MNLTMIWGRFFKDEDITTYNKMKNKYHTVGPVPTFNRKIVDR
jgi:hypothetical protein